MQIDSLRAQLAEAAQGKRFLLQGGDCAELFSYCNPEQIENKVLGSCVWVPAVHHACN